MEIEWKPKEWCRMPESAKSRSGLTRREFGGTLAAGGVVLAVGAHAAADEATPASSPGYFDIHTHITLPWGTRAYLDVAGLLHWMDAHGVARAVVLPLVSPEAWDHLVDTEYVLRETAPHRDRLIPFCAVDPRTTYLGLQAKVDKLRKFQDAGARGFGEHKVGIAMNDPRNLELYQACAEAGLPVLFHLDNVRNTDAPGLPGLEQVLREVPDGIFIGHAQGWWASISGDVTQEELQGYPRKPVAPGGAIDRLMEQYPNIYGDLSAGSGANALLRDPGHAREFLIRRADRLLWGSDYLAPGQEVPQLTLFEDLDLPGEVRQKIFHGNAEKLL